MKRNNITLSAVIALFCLSFAYNAQAQEELPEYFSPFRDFIGKTWKGEFADSTPEKPVIDIQKWELILNGKAIRIMHSLNDGEYGGETIIFRDIEKESLVYYYFTTEGFYTTGTMSFDGESFVSHELVTGNADGITEVKAYGRLLPGGRIHSRSEYLRNGEWIKGHEVFYEEAPGAVLKFKTVDIKK